MADAGPARTTASLWADWLQAQTSSPLYLPIAAVQALLDLFNVMQPVSFVAWQAALWSLSLALMLAPPSAANGVPVADGSTTEYVKHFLKVFVRVLLVLYMLRLGTLLLSNVVFQVVVERPRRARARREAASLVGGGTRAAASSPVAQRPAAPPPEDSALAHTLATQQWARLLLEHRMPAPPAPPQPTQEQSASPLWQPRVV